jgi:hypothetical protein
MCVGTAHHRHEHIGAHIEAQFFGKEKMHSETSWNAAAAREAGRPAARGGEGGGRSRATDHAGAAAAGPSSVSHTRCFESQTTLNGRVQDTRGARKGAAARQAAYGGRVPDRPLLALARWRARTLTLR